MVALDPCKLAVLQLGGLVGALQFAFYTLALSKRTWHMEISCDWKQFHHPHSRAIQQRNNPCEVWRSAGCRRESKGGPRKSVCRRVGRLLAATAASLWDFLLIKNQFCFTSIVIEVGIIGKRAGKDLFEVIYSIHLPQGRVTCAYAIPDKFLP